MEKEVSGIAAWSILGDFIYRIFWICLIVLSAFYVVGRANIGWIVLISVILSGLKTALGLFNYSPFVDILHFYCDLFIGIIVGWGIGDWFNFYSVGFYNFNWYDYILPLLIVVGLNLLKSAISNKRAYRNLFK